MNERIQQLAKQAGLQLGTVLENYTTPVKTITVEQRKFAELIIQECIFAAETHWHTPDGWGWTSGQAKAIEFIYERFGIEE